MPSRSLAHVAQLDDLKALYAWMRSEGCLYARCGDIELRLLPEAKPVGDVAPTPLTPEEIERQHYEELLFSGDDVVDAILDVARGRRKEPA